MNREIKFRAKVYHKPQKVYLGSGCQDGEWVYGDLHLQSANPHIHIKERHKEPIDAETIGQFTGLYDKNGKEVYEGDILKVECTDGSSIYKIVRFVPEKAAFCMANTFEIKDEGRWDIWSYVSQRGIKEIEASVIGNIHDNPELLKQ